MKTTISDTYTTKEDLIPRVKDCPLGMRKGPEKAVLEDNEYLFFYTCYCEDFCRWDMCRLKEPPKECLDGTGSNWFWDFQKWYWVAQTLTGITHCALYFIENNDNVIVFVANFISSYRCC